MRTEDTQWRHHQGWPTEEGYGFTAVTFTCNLNGNVTASVVEGGRDCDGAGGGGGIAWGRHGPHSHGPHSHSPHSHQPKPKGQCRGYCSLYKSWYSA